MSVWRVELGVAGGDTAAAILVALDGRDPGMGQRLTEADGQLRHWVNVFGEGQNVRALNG